MKSKESYKLGTRAKALETKPSSTLLRTRYWGFLRKVLCGLKAYIFLDSSVQRTQLDCLPTQSLITRSNALG